VAATGTRAACAARDGFGFARKTPATFDVFFWLQIRKFDVSLLRSTPNGADHIDIGIFVLHARPPNTRLLKPMSCVKTILFRGRSHDALIHVYDDAGYLIEMHEHAGDFKESL
jgi:hypothetical protein